MTVGEPSSITRGLVESHIAALCDVGDALLKKMQSAQDKEKWGKKIIAVLGIAVGFVGLIAGLLGKEHAFQPVSVWITTVLGFSATATTTMLDPDKRDKTAKACADFAAQLRILRTNTQRKLAATTSEEELSSLLDDTLRPEEKRIFDDAREAGLDDLAGMFPKGTRRSRKSAVLSVIMGE